MAKRRAQSKTSGASITAREREAQAVELRKSGHTYAEIATALGVSRAAGHKMVTRALNRSIERAAESIPQVRKMELDRLDALLKGLWDMASLGDGPAVDRVLRLMSRRAALLGLDMPVQVDLPPALSTGVFTVKLIEDKEEALDAGDTDS